MPIFAGHAFAEPTLVQQKPAAKKTILSTLFLTARYPEDFIRYFTLRASTTQPNY